MSRSVSDPFVARYEQPVARESASPAIAQAWSVPITSFVGAPYLDRHWLSFAERMAALVSGRLVGEVTVIMGCRAYSTHREPLGVEFQTEPLAPESDATVERESIPVRFEIF
jgi:hypothetical protein